MSNYAKKIQQKTAEDKMSSAVFRKCIACSKILDRKDMIRILSDYKTGSVIINPSNNDFGRSKYLCKNLECLKAAIKKKRLKNLSDNDIEVLTQLCK